MSLRALLPLLACCSLLLNAPPARAEPSAAGPMRGTLAEQGELVEVGLYLGALFPAANHELYAFPTVPHREFKNVALDGGARLGYLPRPWLGLELEAGVMPSSAANGESANLFHLRAQVLGQLPYRLAPFVLAGGGWIGVESGSRAMRNDVDAAFHWGVGAKYYATPRLALRLEGRHTLTKGWGPDRRADHFEALAGIALVLGWRQPPPPKPRDSDGDGVLDPRDRCPAVAASGADGCPPPDADGDGVPDARDRCPRQAASSSDGCTQREPDTDGDGVADASDACPRVAARTASGCPRADRDGDGVDDDHDRCPDQAARTPTGCPADADGDGVPDDADRCPTAAETRNGFEDDDGCPDALPQAVQRFTGAIRGITFEQGSARIARASAPALDAAVKVLLAYPTLRLRIRGHTDSTGTRPQNLTLSLGRATAVRDYLTQHGVPGARLVAEGVASDEPVALNVTPRGRAKNRRIEFRIEVSN
ncbi:MAG: OmpA family protein [Proteobacteria bacterium]|nr:OmpA family protein [Pseudomonadota bacterium]